MRDRIAALMVRAAASGAIDYAKCDPYDSKWRVKHVLIMREMARQEDSKLIAAAHNHWLAYVSHSNLEADSWQNMKSRAAAALEQIQANIFPWIEVEEKSSKNDTIDGKYGHLIAQYRALVASQQPPAEEEIKDAGS